MAENDWKNKLEEHKNDPSSSIDTLKEDIINHLRSSSCSSISDYIIDAVNDDKTKKNI